MQNSDFTLQSREKERKVAERGKRIGKNESKRLLSDKGIFLPFGSGKNQNHKTIIFSYGKRSALNHFKIVAYNFLPKFDLFVL